MSHLCVCRLPTYTGAEHIPIHQQEMMTACGNGDVSGLQALFNVVGVVRGQTPSQRGVDVIHRSGPPATSDMLHTAVTNNQPETLRLLLQIYPSVNVSTDTLLGSEFANPDLPTLKVLHSHDPSIVNLEMGEKGLGTLLEDYCHNDNLQRAEYLLENGASPNGTGPPSIKSPLWRL